MGIKAAATQLGDSIAADMESRRNRQRSVYPEEAAQLASVSGARKAAAGSMSLHRLTERLPVGASDALFYELVPIRGAHDIQSADQRGRADAFVISR